LASKRKTYPPAWRRRSLAWNGITARAEILVSDFRNPGVLAREATFDLITGTPPYFPPGAGPESEHVQRGPCRFEHRGGIEEYCAAAAPRLGPGAPFVACQAWNQRERVEPAARAAGMQLVRWREIIPRAGKEPLLCIFAMRKTEAAEPLVVESPLVVRDEQGRRTGEFCRHSRCHGHACVANEVRKAASRGKAGLRDAAIVPVSSGSADR
jgi:tRNA1Val (adenine37-N6)-methyltransferase